MSHDKKPGEFTPEELRENLSNFDPATLGGSATGEGGSLPSHTDPQGPPRPDQAEVAQQTRIQQEARHHPMPDRDEKMVEIGRGGQIAGRQGQ